ncbi:hypothetical protein [Aeromonas veronii]|uniref:hypothetical protein n=1 Tax=Aeromonas veronii TaxID=654 RepID=UPI003BA1BC56
MLPEVVRDKNVKQTPYYLSKANLIKSVESNKRLFDFESYPSWNRWLISHHCSFLIWSIVIHKLNEREQVDEAVSLLKAYSEILSYTRLIKPIEYEREIRPFMSAFWPGFSAVWSHEFQVLKGVINSISINGTASSLLKLKEVYKENHIEHMKTAKALVPEGKSLLQEIKKAGAVISTSSEELNYVYDCMFLVKRAAVSIDDLHTQLKDRLNTLLNDVGSFDSRLIETDFYYVNAWLNTVKVSTIKMAG